MKITLGGVNNTYSAKTKESLYSTNTFFAKLLYTQFLLLTQFTEAEKILDFNPVIAASHNCHRNSKQDANSMHISPPPPHNFPFKMFFLLMYYVDKIVQVKNVTKIYWA